RRFYLHRHLVRPAFHPEQATGYARGQFGQTLACFTGYSDNSGGWLQGFRLQLLERHAGAGKNAAADRRTALRGDDQGAGAARGATETDRSGRRARAAYAERNGRHDPPRDRAQSQDRKGSRAEVQLSGRYTCRNLSLTPRLHLSDRNVTRIAP